jgi:hypothetical protein
VKRFIPLSAVAEAEVAMTQPYAALDNAMKQL